MHRNSAFSGASMRSMHYDALNQLRQAISVLITAIRDTDFSNKLTTTVGYFFAIYRNIKEDISFFMKPLSLFIYITVVQYLRHMSSEVPWMYYRTIYFVLILVSLMTYNLVPTQNLCYLVWLYIPHYVMSYNVIITGEFPKVTITMRLGFIKVRILSVPGAYQAFFGTFNHEKGGNSRYFDWKFAYVAFLRLNITYSFMKLYIIHFEHC